MASKNTKSKTHFSCQSCGTSAAKWLGRCPGCGEWNTFVEESEPREASASAGGLEFWRETGVAAVSTQHAQALYPLAGNADAARGGSADEPDGDRPRIATGLRELDRALGGGLVPDSFVLLGGDPGIGKSTLLLQMAGGLSAQGLKVLYVSGEESPSQIRARARRLGVHDEGRIFLASETQLERAFATVQELRPQVLLMDSLQTFSSVALESAPGSVSQVREVSAKLMQLAKSAGIAVWLVGHVTKEGAIAGPKTVEHMVDTVLYFEGDTGLNYRLLRTVKNRFGSVRELGVFEMTEDGLQEVDNPSSLFLAQRPEAVAGTAIAASLEGTRPLLVELQALVAPSPLAMPRRTALGMDSTRVGLLSAILERHVNLSLAQRDLFFNVSGGLKLSEPACDLAAVAAIASSASQKPWPMDWVFAGELSLTGEVRRVSQLDHRLLEARKLGFRCAVVPGSTPEATLERCRAIDGLKLVPVHSVKDLVGLVTDVQVGNATREELRTDKRGRPDARQSLGRGVERKALDGVERAQDV